MTQHHTTALTELTREELDQAQGGAQFSVQLYFGTPDVRSTGWGSSMYQYAYNDPTY